VKQSEEVTECNEDAEELKDFRQLRQKFHDEGWFHTDYKWLTMKTGWLVVILFCTFWLVNFLNSVSWQYKNELLFQWMRILVAGIGLGLFWQQAAFLAHDCLHGATFHDRKLDALAGWFYGNVLYGVSGLWWKDDHNKHHAYTNCFDECGFIVDLQQNVRPFFVQSKALLPYVTNAFERIIIKIQHWSFIPVCLFIGRFAIIFVSGSSPFARKVHEIIGVLLHWCYVSALLYTFLPDNYERLTAFFIACSVEGILHIQLELSHFCKTMMPLNDCTMTNFVIFQLQTTRNIDCPEYLDWFHGGLQFQIEHHLFPRIPRHNLRKVMPFVKELCKKHNIEYEMKPFLSALVDILTDMKHVAHPVS